MSELTFGGIEVCLATEVFFVSEVFWGFSFSFFLHCLSRFPTTPRYKLNVCSDWILKRKKTPLLYKSCQLWPVKDEVYQIHIPSMYFLVKYAPLFFCMLNWSRDQQAFHTGNGRLYARVLSCSLRPIFFGKTKQNILTCLLFLPTLL